MDLQQFLEVLKEDQYIAGGSPAHEYMNQSAQEALRLTAQLNSGYHTPQEIQKLFSQIIGKPVDETFSLFPPFYTEFGKNITIGKNVFINMGCKFQDHGGIILEDGVLIGHGVVLATLNHDLNPDTRAAMRPGPIHIGKNVWVGAHATILPGVTIGDGAVVAAGAVVHRDVPAYTVVGGVPAKVLKNCLEAGKENTGAK